MGVIREVLASEMIYIEFIEREAGTPIEVFRHLGNQQSAWRDGANDRMVLQLGRTLRLGPRPSYLCLWEIPDIGRLDAWEEYFHSSAAAENRRSQAMHRAISIQRAGLYDVLWRAETLDSVLYLVLYCEPHQLTNEAVLGAYGPEQDSNQPLRHILLLRRVGRAGPDPSVLAVWGGSSYVALEPLIRTEVHPKLSVVDLGIYRPFGAEIL
jgi:hypothetical protein